MTDCGVFEVGVEAEHPAYNTIQHNEIAAL
jgi:hypothetical protein